MYEIKCVLQGALFRPKRYNGLFITTKQLYLVRANSGSSKPPSSSPVHRPSNASNTPFRTQPGPPLLAPEEQREFDELVRKAQAPLATSPKTHTTGAMDPSSSGASDATAAVLERHPDARKPLPPEFIGDVNPKTGERGGPKREPVKFGDWSYAGKVTDF